MAYICKDHKLVAMVDLGIYNWKQHSTGYLRLQLINHEYKSHEYEWEWIKLCNSKNPETLPLYWRSEWLKRIRDELKNRPHQSTKSERKKAKIK